MDFLANPAKDLYNTTSDLIADFQLSPNGNKLTSLSLPYVSIRVSALYNWLIHNKGNSKYNHHLGILSDLRDILLSQSRIQFRDIALLQTAFNTFIDAVDKLSEV